MDNEYEDGFAIGPIGFLLVGLLVALMIFEVGYQKGVNETKLKYEIQAGR